jgi:hypothetical protein
MLIFSHFIVTQHCNGMTLNEKKIFDLSLDLCDKYFTGDETCKLVISSIFDDQISNMNVRTFHFFLFHKY